MAGELQDPRNLVPVQILVLFSLGLQVLLFLCAGARRKETSSSVRLRIWVLWLAYNLGDGLATFTLSRLAFFSVAGSHPLMPLWAPFLLLHLAGPDNIAAYALQDSQLSLRSLYTFFARIIAGVYFLYAYRNSSGDFIGLASRLVSAVAVVKYWERWLAMKRGNLGSIRDSLKQKKPPPAIHVHPHDVKFQEGSQTLDEESSVRRAHWLFHICKCGMVDSSQEKPGRENFTEKMKHSEYWIIAEMQLSLMYDMLYTKAAVIHTWHGYTTRVISPLAVSASLLLFHFSGEDVRHSEDVDTAMTYVLLGSALFMELTSLLNALGSSWMLATRSPWLRYHFLCSGRWDRLRRLVISLNSFVTCGRGSRSGARRWSGNMGQYNMLHFCTRPDDLLTHPLLGRLAELVGFGEWWNRKHFSGATNISDHGPTIKVCINTHIHQHLYREKCLSTLGLTPHWGMKTIVRHELLVDMFEKTLGEEFQEGIIIWHIGTDFFLSNCKSTADHEDLVNAVRALSNYMMFLLVERPYMLPGIAQNRLYERTCEALVERPYMRHQPRSLCATLKSLFRWRDGPDASYTSRATHTKNRAEKLYQYFYNQKISYDTVRLTYSSRVANELLIYEYNHDTTKSLNVLLEVWTDMLVYAGNRGSRESHAKKLSSGGELTTIMWLMVEHFHQALLIEVDDKKTSNEGASSKKEYLDDNYTV